MFCVCVCSVLPQIPQHHTHFADGASTLPESSSSDRVSSGSSHSGSSCSSCSGGGTEGCGHTRSSEPCRQNSYLIVLIPLPGT